jgi:tRNA-dihydrouridine synthase B
MKYPIIGLAPMDGVTDVAFRSIVDDFGKPDLLYTEFISVKGILVGAPAIYRTLLKHQSPTPVIVQLFGNDPELFYRATIKVLDLGFDGVDINMGCHARSVITRGGGAALILKPDLAIRIIKSVQKAVKDTDKKGVTVSVKTRTGYKTQQTKRWIGKLLEAEPDTICVHGRTFTQKHTGRADWKQIGLAAGLAKNTKTKIFGNGDVQNRSQALEKIKQYNLAGVLIGRAALGNPWIFRDKVPSFDERREVMLEHCRRFNQYFPEGNFVAMRKHLAWYAKDFPNSARVRNELMKVKNVEEVKAVIENIKLDDNRYNKSSKG